MKGDIREVHTHRDQEAFTQEEVSDQGPREKRNLDWSEVERERRLERVCESEKQQEKHRYTEGVMRMAPLSSRELQTLAVSRQGTWTSRRTLLAK